MNLIDKCVAKLVGQEKLIKVVFVEGHSRRMIAAAKQLKEQKILEPIMLVETTNQLNSLLPLCYK